MSNFQLFVLMKTSVYTALVMMNKKGKNLCGYLCQAGMLITVNENLIHKCIIIDRTYEWLHKGSSFNGHTVIWVEEHVRLSFLVLLLVYVMSFQKLMVSILALSWLTCSLHLHYFYYETFCLRE